MTRRGGREAGRAAQGARCRAGVAGAAARARPRAPPAHFLSSLSPATAVAHHSLNALDLVGRVHHLRRWAEAPAGGGDETHGVFCRAFRRGQDVRTVKRGAPAACSSARRAPPPPLSRTHACRCWQLPPLPTGTTARGSHLTHTHTRKRTGTPPPPPPPTHTRPHQKSSHAACSSQMGRRALSTAELHLKPDPNAICQHPVAPAHRPRRGQARTGRRRRDAQPRPARGFGGRRLGAHRRRRLDVRQHVPDGGGGRVAVPPERGDGGAGGFGGQAQGGRHLLDHRPPARVHAEMVKGGGKVGDVGREARGAAQEAPAPRGRRTGSGSGLVR